MVVVDLVVVTDLCFNTRIICAWLELVGTQIILLLELVGLNLADMCVESGERGGRDSG
jgi:hypothetical protein